MFAAGSLAVMIWSPCATDMVHVANVLYLCSYLVRDILWLRVLSVAAGLSLMPYYCRCGEHPLWAPIGWNALFAFVNLVQIAILVFERWPRSLQGPERQLYERVFPELSVSEFLKLLKRASWRDVATGERVVEQGAVVPEMMVLTAGGMAVRAGDRVIAKLEPGQFVGEMSFLSGNRAAADVVATKPCRVLVWPQGDLAKLLDRSAGLSFKLRAVLGRDVVAKLRAHGDPAS
ncbi:MAG: hypothetical protein RLZZ440_1151 [Planctomycetota bacterium]|jgi:hypothetical protein